MNTVLARQLRRPDLSDLGRRYGLALLATGLAALLRWALQGQFGDTLPYITFFPAVAVCAIVGGAGPGIVAGILSVLAVLLWFTGPPLSSGVTAAGAALGAAFFVGAAVFTGVVAEMLHRSRRREHEARLAQLEAEAQQQCDQAMRDSEMRFRTMVQAVPSLIFEGDAQGNNIFASDRWYAYTGLTPEQTAGWGWAAAIHPDDVESAKARWTEAMGRGTPYDGRHRLRGADGTYRWFMVRVMPWRDDRGNIIRWAGSLTDIDDLVRTDAALRTSEELSRRLLASSYDCIKVVDLEGRLLFLNEGGCRLMEIQDPELYLNKPYINFWRPEDWPKVRKALATAQDGGVGRFEGFSPSVTGRPRWWDVRVTPVRGATGQPQRLLIIARDTTDAKEAEDALRDMVARLDRHITNSPLAIVEWDGEHRITTWNPAAERIFGWTAAEALGQHIESLPLIHEDDLPAVRRVIADKITGVQPSSISRNRNRRKDGTVIECEWHNSAIYDDHGTLRSVLSLVADVTERNRTERELAAAKTSAERAMAAAEQANRAKDHFLAVLSHELRTPLTPVLTAASLLAEDRQLPPRCHEDVDLIRRNVELEARLIDDLLDVTRIVRGKVELHRQPVDLCEVIRRAVEVCRPDIDARGLHFSMQFWNDGSVIVLADGTRLQQVFWNLIKNAIKFTPHGGCVGVRCQRDGSERVLVEVQDSGIGIEPHVLPRLFNAFEQGSAQITGQFGGLGLGLTISRGLIEMHGGQLDAHSEGHGKGATFRVTLPLHKTAGAAPPAGQHSPPVRPRRLRILLVEDHGDTANIMRRLLARQGHEVHAAGDVATALELAAQHPFDLLISDLGLPDRSGLELMRELRARGLSMPGLALSGYGLDQDIQRSREAGFAQHLTKPINPAQLQQAIVAVSAAG